MKVLGMQPEWAVFRDIQRGFISWQKSRFKVLKINGDDDDNHQGWTKLARFERCVLTNSTFITYYFSCFIRLWNCWTGIQTADIFVFQMYSFREFANDLINRIDSIQIYIVTGVGQPEDKLPRLQRKFSGILPPISSTKLRLVFPISNELYILKFLLFEAIKYVKRMILLCSVRSHVGEPFNSGLISSTQGLYVHFAMQVQV